MPDALTFAAGFLGGVYVCAMVMIAGILLWPER